jgi:hypothetical protein
MPDDRILVPVQLQRAQYKMATDLEEELRMDLPTLMEHAITSLWVDTQLKRAAAKIK